MYANHSLLKCRKDFFNYVNNFVSNKFLLGFVGILSSDPSDSVTRIDTLMLSLTNYQYLTGAVAVSLLKKVFNNSSSD